MAEVSEYGCVKGANVTVGRIASVAVKGQGFGHHVACLDYFNKECWANRSLEKCEC